MQLMAALDLDSSQQPLNHRKMTAVIRYHTPYLIKNRDPFLFLLLWIMMFHSVVL